MSAPEGFDPGWATMTLLLLIWVLLVLNIANQAMHLSGHGGLFR